MFVSSFVELSWFSWTLAGCRMHVRCASGLSSKNTSVVIRILITHRIHVCYILLYMVTFTIHIPQMLAYIPAPWIRHGLLLLSPPGKLVKNPPILPIIQSLVFFAHLHTPSKSRSIHWFPLNLIPCGVSAIAAIPQYVVEISSSPISSPIKGPLWFPWKLLSIQPVKLDSI